MSPETSQPASPPLIAEEAADLVQDEVNNGTDDIPTAKLDTTLIHLEDGKDPGDIVQQAVDLGIFTWEQICDGGPAASTPTCQAKVG